MPKYNSINTADRKLLKNPLYINKDRFWYDDPSILLNFSRLDEFFPTRDMTIEEQLNSSVRLSIYISFVMYIYTFNANYLYITIITLIFTYMIYKNSDNTVTKEQYSNSESTIVTPTIDNPLMNVLPEDYVKNPKREAISKLNNYKNKDIDDQIREKLNYNLYTDSSDIYGRNTSHRQFYTTPVTTIPNEQGKFANWLYKTPPTCKEGNGLQCIQNNFEHLKDSNIRNGIY